MAIRDRPCRTLFYDSDLCIAAGENEGGYQQSGYVFQVCHNVLLGFAAASDATVLLFSCTSVSVMINLPDRSIVPV